MRYLHNIKFQKLSRLLLSFLPTIVILLLVLGSGSIRIQIGAFIIIFVNFLRILFFAFKHKYLNNAVTLCSLFLTAAITVSAIMSVIQAVSLAEIVLYNFSMYLFIILFLSAKTKIIDYKGYMNVALVFSFIVIFLVCAGMFDIFGGRQLQAKALKVFSGMDGQKPIAGMIFQGFYLQGTLTLIPACVFFIHQKKYKNFLICFFCIGFVIVPIWTADGHILLLPAIRLFHRVRRDAVRDVCGETLSVCEYVRPDCGQRGGVPCGHGVWAKVCGVRIRNIVGRLRG